MSEPTIYLAGPSLYAPDARAITAYMQNACKQRGAIGIAPSENMLPPSVLASASSASKQQMGGGIFRLTRLAIDHADGVVASLEPFRGSSPDVNTVWALAYAFAKDKPIAAWSPIVNLYRQRVPCTSDEQGLYHDEDGFLVEDFDFFDGTSLIGSLRERSGHDVFDDFAHALQCVLDQIRNGVPA